MAQEQIQEQRLTQEQRLAQTITQQQLLQAQLIELPITQLMERVTTEMDDNPALEVSTEDPVAEEFQEHLETSEGAEGAEDDYEREERQSALDAALESLGRDDEDLPIYQGGHSIQEAREDMVYGQSQSFYDQLNEQMNMPELSDEERPVTQAPAQYS